MRVSIVSGIALSHPFVERFPTPLDQLHPLQARVPVLADDDVVVHRDAERGGDVDDRAGHSDIGLRRRRIAPHFEFSSTNEPSADTMKVPVKGLKLLAPG